MFLRFLKLMNEGGATAAADPSSPANPEGKEGTGEGSPLDPSNIAAVLEALRQGTAGEPEGDEGGSEGEGEIEGGEEGEGEGKVEKPPAPVAASTPRRDPDHFLKIQVRDQGKLIRKLQGEITSLKDQGDRRSKEGPSDPAPADFPEPTVDDMVDPKKFAAYLKRRDQVVEGRILKASAKSVDSIRGEISPTVEQNKATRAMREVYGDSPMGTSLLANPVVLQFIEEQGSDPTVVESLKDPYRMRTEALLFRFLTRLYGAQQQVRSAAAATPVKRKEMAGAGSPKAGGGPTKPGKGEPMRDQIAKLPPDQAWAAMQKAARSIGAL